MCAFIALAFHVWRSWRREAKHDQVLFPFCELRRNIYRFLFDSMMADDAITHAEYKSVRRLARMLDDTIDHYNHHKTSTFNLRVLLRDMREYRHALRQADALDITENPEIQLFYRRFAVLLARAVIAYTPLIRWEIALRLLVWRAGKIRAAYARNVAALVRSDARTAITPA
jgi:hypothetical protein